MSNYSNFDLRKFLTEGKKADKETMEEQDEVALSEDFELNEAPATDLLDLLNNPEALQIAAMYGGALFAAVKGGMSAFDYCEANPDNKLCKMWKNFSSDFSSAKKQAREKGRGYEEGVEEENLNEEPVSIAAVAAGVAALFGGSVGLVKLMDKLEAGDFGDKGEKLAAHLRKYGKGAADAIHHRGFEEGANEEVDESVIAGVAALIGSSLAAGKVLDYIADKYPEATKKFISGADAAMRGSGKSGMMENEDEKKKGKMDEAKFKEKIKSILES